MNPRTPVQHARACALCAHSSLISLAPFLASYTDTDGRQGAVTRIFLKRTTVGTFVLRITARGTNGTLNLRPPNPGTEGFVPSHPRR